MEWNEMGWSGVRWHIVGWDGDEMGWGRDGIGGYGMGWDEVGWVGWDGMGLNGDGMGWDVMFCDRWMGCSGVAWSGMGWKIAATLWASWCGEWWCKNGGEGGGMRSSAERLLTPRPFRDFLN